MLSKIIFLKPAQSAGFKLSAPIYLAECLFVFELRLPQLYS
jgi:hypothetical protein